MDKRLLSNALKHIGGTFTHKGWVLLYGIEFSGRLMRRVLVHDLSKMMPDEMDGFVRVIDHLRATEYMSERYKELLAEIGPSLQNHYRRNSHHPEHHRRGLEGMDLLDVVEMFLDWRASCKRYKDGDILSSVRRNQKRFRLGTKLSEILANEARRRMV